MEKQDIGVITFPTSKAGIIPISNLVNILYPLSKNLFLITGDEGYNFFRKDNRIHTYGIKHEIGKGTFLRILHLINTQLRISYKLAKTSRKVDVWIFFIGETLLFPMLTAKLFRKNVILIFTGSSFHSCKSANDPLSKQIEILQNTCCFLSNRILLCSINLIKDWNLEKFKGKISIAHEHFINFSEFKVKTKINRRANIVGYIGRLSKEKGIENFIKAIPLITKQKHDLQFFIGGDGPLFDEIGIELKKSCSHNKVKLGGWIPHDKLPEYLNEMKLIVIPSYTESGPLIALEAISCGTPILATSVGLIPNIVKDGETGFILEDNSPKNIAKGVIKALECENLAEIVEYANELIKRDYTYEAAVKKYCLILGIRYNGLKIQK